jgi:tRNA(adenine34) deaminase
MNSDFTPKEPTFYMHHALTLASRAAQQGEVPIGALVVDEKGEIIGRGFNKVEQGKSQLEHAEIRALKAAARKRGDWRLSGCTLYVTLEPCGMCIHFALLSRICIVVYGASSPLFGYTSYEKHLITKGQSAAQFLDNNKIVQLYQRDAIKIVAGVCSDEASALLRQFFKSKRSQANDISKKRAEC